MRIEKRLKTPKVSQVDRIMKRVHVNPQMLTYDFERLVGKTKKFGILDQYSLKLIKGSKWPAEFYRGMYHT